MNNALAILTTRWPVIKVLDPIQLSLSLAGIAVRSQRLMIDFLKRRPDLGGRACLDAHPWELKACDGKRLAMEAEERAYNNMSFGPPTNVNLQSR